MMEAMTERARKMVAAAAALIRSAVGAESRGRRARYTMQAQMTNMERGLPPNGAAAPASAG